MNFYSDKIINDIIDNKPIDNIIDIIETFIETSYSKITKYSLDSISYKYIYTIFSLIKSASNSLNPVKFKSG